MVCCWDVSRSKSSYNQGSNCLEPIWVLTKVGIPNFVSGPREYTMEGEYVILAMCSWFRISWFRIICWHCWRASGNKWISMLTCWGHWKITGLLYLYWPIRLGCYAMGLPFKNHGFADEWFGVELWTKSSALSARDFGFDRERKYWENIFLKENIIFWTLKGPENNQNSNLGPYSFISWSTCSVPQTTHISWWRQMKWVLDGVQMHITFHLVCTTKIKFLRL